MASAGEGSPSQCSSSTASDGQWAGARAGQQLVPTAGARTLPPCPDAAMERDAESDEFPVRRKRRVLDGAARSPQTRRRRRVLSSLESSGESGNVLARDSKRLG
jgi:hypothetical protein